MKHLVLIFSILISISNITYGQANLFEKYPFNEAVSIKLISYSNMDLTQPYWKSQSCIEIPLLNNALNGTHVDFTRLDKVETINLLEAAKLYKIAYGDNFNCTVPIRPTNCNDVKSGYGILFLDQDDRIFTLLNFCLPV